MVLLVTTLLPERASDVVGAKATACDLLEIRLDALAREDIAEAVQAAGVPVIATCRRAEDGGVNALDEAERQARLAAALEAGAAFVDVEHDAPFRSELTEQALLEGARVIVSHHDLEQTPAPHEVLDLLSGMREKADIIKLATACQGPEDLQRLFEAALEAPTLGVPFAIMGIGDSALRAAAGPMGMALVYTSPGRVAVPGQLATPLQRALPRTPPPPEGFRDYVLLGHPVGHSLSPRMQNAAFSHLDVGARYRPVDVAPEDLDTAFPGLLAMGVAGGNVTSPHKGSIYERCQVTTPVAEEARAVNTFTLRDGTLHGHNTDGLGVVHALQARGEPLDGRQAVILGAGGTARAAAHALSKAGCELTLANRTRSRAQALADELDGDCVPLEPTALDKALPEGALLFNATPVDPPVPDKALARACIFDATYGPEGATLARRAKLAGTRALDGLDLLVHQGDLGLRTWLDIAADEKTLGVMSTAARTGALEKAFGRGPP